MTVRDDVSTSQGTKTGDLTGDNSTDVLVIYDTVAGVTSKLGNANVNGTTWTYTSPVQVAGAHSFTAQVESPANGFASASSAVRTVRVQEVIFGSINCSSSDLICQ